MGCSTSPYEHDGQVLYIFGQIIYHWQGRNQNTSFWLIFTEQKYLVQKLQENVYKLYPLYIFQCDCALVQLQKLTWVTSCYVLLLVQGNVGSLIKLSEKQCKKPPPIQHFCQDQNKFYMLWGSLSRSPVELFSRFVLPVVWMNTSRAGVSVEKCDFKSIACHVLIQLLIQMQALRIVGAYATYVWKQFLLCCQAVGCFSWNGNDERTTSLVTGALALLMQSKISHASLTLMYYQTSQLPFKDIWHCFDLSRFHKTCQTLGLFGINEEPAMSHFSDELFDAAAFVAVVGFSVGFRRLYNQEEILKQINMIKLMMSEVVQSICLDLRKSLLAHF